MYKNSFFLKDGLIGEYAKGKIKSLVNFFDKKLNTTQPNDIVTEWKQEDAKAFIEIIGEPVLKEALLDLYREHFKDEIKESE